MRTPCSLKGTRAASATFVKTRGDRDSPKGRTCTDMLVLRTQTAGMACGMEGSTHGSTGLQVNAADRTWGRMHPKTRFCMSILSIKMRRPKIGRNPPLFLGTMKQGLKNPAFISAGGTGTITSFASRTEIPLTSHGHRLPSLL